MYDLGQILIPLSCSFFAEIEILVVRSFVLLVEAFGLDAIVLHVLGKQWE
jgi:hypothetical protein